ncbi:vWA domain-containing protein [Corynebacterium terpenotabidum]|uniref:VWFA domain-containing protein n=1 Tax=Corynebacterium terpenotabidum Y-11 TaxID=1200352 RepID=S4XBD8_9CORY|nr:vWA domain-containing protein [Corynebacterium terpenotabidum]AGP29784.1 hypothetical protein A606_00645 [Corynebacterium terpenotabidum Y-11]
MTSTQSRVGRIASALGTTVLLAGAALLGASPAAAQTTGISEDGQNNINALGSCIAATKSANILLILDQSASLKGFDDKTATDPDNVRVDATRDLVQQLSTHATDLGADINVKLAGFGEGYHNATGDYGDWVNVGEDADKLESAISGFNARNADMYTNYGDALAGASREFAGAPTTDGKQSDCQAVLFFSDGKVTAPGVDDDEAAASVCRADSPLVALRNSGVHFFTVGLIPTDESDSPRELLTEMAEGTCGGGTPNGAFFDAGTDPSGLLAAFRSFIPTSNSVDATLSMKEPTKFTLDNSIDTVRLSALPTSSIDGQVTPVLTAPGGQQVSLDAEASTVGDAQIHVAPESGVVNGAVTAELSLPAGGDWAGEWSFGYDAPTADDDSYKVRVTLAPGLSVQVDELTDSQTTGLKSDAELHATLVDKNGEPRQLDGDALLTATFTSSDGTDVELGQQSAADGTPVAFSLDKITEATSGRIAFRADITTKAADNAPGTQLSPVTVDFAVTVTPVNMPTLGSADLSIDSTETTIEIPVTGPGSVWLNSTELSSGDDGVALPDGVGTVEISSDYADAASALELDEGEEGVLPVTLKTSDLADGRISVTPQVHLVSDDGETESDVDVPLSGNMTAPVNTGVFIGALIGVLLLAILIPLAVLYIMKAITGRIPSSPGIHAVRIPVAVERGRLLRTDTGGDFRIGYDELLGSGRTVASGREVNLAGVPVRVKLGKNPLTAPLAVVDAPAPSISDEGQQVGTAARLPLAVHNHWFVLGTPGDPTHGEVVLAVDEFTTEGRVSELAGKIGTDTPELLERLAATPVPGPGTTRRGRKGKGNAVPTVAQENYPGSGFPGGDGYPPTTGFPPTTGGPTSFGGQSGPTGGGFPGAGGTGGTWGSGPGTPSSFGR